jgi:hypothetical protein
VIITHGDQYRIDCPACGKVICDLWDLGNGLVTGGTTECPHCEAELNIEEVDIAVDVALSVKKGGEA